jgi:DNA-binding LytR/AlgR family response regulator
MYRKYRKSQKEVRQLQKRIDKLRHNKVHRSSKSISLKNKTVLDSKDILYIKSDGHYVEYHLEDKTSPIVERRSLTKTLENLPENEFTRVHKSYVVNLYRLKIINSTQLMLDTGEWIPLSRTYKPALKELLNKK